MSYLNGIASSQVNAGTTEAISASASSRAVKESSPQSVEAASKRSDEATVSAAGSLVAQALSGSDVRSEKVAALQQSIAAGTYHVPASSVADKVIGSLMS